MALKKDFTDGSGKVYYLKLYRANVVNYWDECADLVCFMYTLDNIDADIKKAKPDETQEFRFSIPSHETYPNPEAEGTVLISEDYVAPFSIEELSKEGVDPFSRGYEWIKENIDLFKDWEDC